MRNSESPTVPSIDEGRYRILVESITDYAIYMLDPSGIVISWNAGAERFKGYKPAEIIGHPFSRFYTPEDRAAGAPERALAIAATEGRYESEGWRLRKDGTHFWTHAIIDPIRSPDGQLIGYAKITRDLSERKAAEEALQRSEEQFSLLVQGVTDYAIYMLDADGRIISWNSGAQRIKGYRPEEIIGNHFSRFYREAERSAGEPEQGLKIARETGRFEKEAWRVRKDGSHFWAHVVIDAIKDDSGRVIGYAKVTRDITERRETQRALEEAREALFQSQKMEAIGQLTGGVAHDFNNLLMVVLGSLELLRKRMPQDPKLISLVDNATHAAKRGASLTQRMLAFARRQDLERRPVDLAELVGGMSDLVQRSLGPTIRVQTSFPPTLPHVLSDPNQLETALLNLVVNARDAMPEGGDLQITAEERDADGGDAGLPAGRYVCLSISDSGEGMDEDTITRATEPFFTTKGVGKGTGLGLSMVQGFVAQSGGRLTVTSRQGHGTTIEIWLPLAQGDNERHAPVLSQEAAPPSDCQRLNVLAIDDDALVLMNTVAMLEDLGHTVTEAISADKALEIMRSGQDFDLIVTDHAMPRMTGMEFAKVVRDEWPNMPILMATGYAELPEGNVLNLPKLSKPFDQIQLEQAVQDAIQPAGLIDKMKRFFSMSSNGLD